MAEDIDEVFAQGSKPGDRPIRSTVRPLNPEAARVQVCIDLLKGYKKGDIPDGRTDELFNALIVSLGITQTDTELQDESGLGMMNRLKNMLRRR